MAEKFKWKCKFLVMSIVQTGGLIFLDVKTACWKKFASYDILTKILMDNTLFTHWFYAMIIWRENFHLIFGIFYRMLWNVKLSVSGIVMSRTAKLPSPEEPGLTLPPPQPQWDPPSGVWEKWRTCKKSLINKKVQAQDLKKCCLFASNPRSKCAWTNCDVFPWIKHFAYDPRNVPVHPGVASRNPILSAFITEGNDANQLHPI